jgi:hypothetical protein
MSFAQIAHIRLPRMAFTGIWVSRLKLISRAYPVPLLACMDCDIRAARRALPQ